MISAIIPARNEEASIRETVESVADQAEISEIIAVDDQSSDQTGAILSELAERIPKLKVLMTGELPAGWTGKNHAASLGAAAASEEWLLFTDADTHHLPGSAGRALGDAAIRDAELVSYSPEQAMETFWERALIPVVYWRLSQRYSYERVSDRKSADAAANGQYILMRRQAYRAVGGHAAIAGEILEDVELAKRVKQTGRGIYFAPGAGIVRTRMYRSFGAMWEGWTKNLHPLFGGTLGDVALEIDAATPWLSLPLGAVLGSEWLLYGRWDWLLAVVTALFLVRPWASYEAWLRRNRYSGSFIKYYPAGACLYAAALVASWWKNTRGAVAWKGREYKRSQRAFGTRD